MLKLNLTVPSAQEDRVLICDVQGYLNNRI